jgi:menaquinone-9 beta-reductase
VEPFTGEGIAWALASGKALAPIAVAMAAKWDDGAVRCWNRIHAELISARQHDCKLVAALLRRKRLTATVISLLKHFPGLAKPVMRRLGRPYPVATMKGAT